MRTVSIIGASGLIGARLLTTLRAHQAGVVAASGTRWRSPGPPELKPLDATDPEALRAHLGQGFDWVFVAAGTKDVARCQAEPAYARALNATPIATLAAIVARERLPTRLVYLSTDQVFDGERGLYREDEAPSPRTRYGESKAEGEAAVLASGAHLVVRTGAVMARGGRFFDWLLASLARPGEVPLYEDCWFSPTPLQLLCDVVAGVLCGRAEPQGGVVHVVGERRMSRLELGRAIAGLVPTTRGTLVPMARPGGDPHVPRDVSLVPSPVVARLARRPLDQYLADEVRGVAG